MDNATQTLVIIVSSVLTIFLIASIVAVIKIIQILNYIKQISAKAEKVADAAESVGEFFQKTAGPAAIAKLIGNVAHSFRHRKDKGGKQ